MITNKHQTLPRFQNKTSKIIMKQVVPEITQINTKFREIRKQSLDNDYEICLMKHCDLTMFSLKEWNTKCKERA